MTRLFPKSQDFDYRTVFSENDDEKVLGKYFDPELMNFLNRVTASDREMERTDSHSNLYKYSRKLKMTIICALLTNTMDTRSTFLQTLLGLVCYAQGLRDKGFKFFNSFGVFVLEYSI